jgi:fucose permease
VSIPVYCWLPIFGFLGLGFIFMSAPSVADQFMNVFSVGYGGLSFFLSAIFWTHAAVQVPAGLFIDRIGVFRSLLACIAACVIGSLGPLIQPDNLAVAIAFRLILGASTGTMFLLFVKILQILTPPDRIARAQGMQGAAFCLGTMLPYLTLTHTGASGWLAAYFSGAVFCAMLGACSFRLPWAPLREHRATADSAQIWQAIKAICTSRRIWLLGCYQGFSYGSLTAIGNWLPTILADTRAGSTMEAWAVATSAILLLGTIGRIFSGDASRLMPRPIFIRRATLCIGVLYALLAMADSPISVLISAMVLAVFCGITYAAIITLTIDISSSAYVATAVGFMNMIANGVNILLILVLGNTREFSGGFGLGLGLAALGAAVICVWGCCMDRRGDVSWPAVGDQGKQETQR